MSNEVAEIKIFHEKVAEIKIFHENFMQVLTMVRTMLWEMF